MVIVKDSKPKSKSPRGSKGSAASAPARASTPFSSLPRAAQRRIARRIVGGLRSSGFFARGGYRTVWGPDQINRRWTAAETGDELQQLTASERNRLIALARNTARNSEHMEGILTQLANNIIGVEGGKAIFTFPEGYEAQQKAIHRAFAEWCQEAEYFDDQSLQDLLRLLLRTLYIGGDLVVVFDSRMTRRDSGQIITFEPDCVGNIADDEFARLFPGYSQHQGIIKDENGKTIGCIVSWAQRGQSVFKTRDESGRLAVWILLKKPGDRWLDTPFAMMRNFHRVNQMRGSSPLWSGLGTISDGADLQGFEVQASKRNAQVIGQVTQGEAETGEAELSAELDPDAVAPIAVGEDLEGVEEEEAVFQRKLETDALNSAGVIYDVMPENCKFELLDTKHPNTNLVEFSKWLHSGAAYAAGLTSLFATGKADSSYSAAMAEMILAQTQFRVEFQRLERHFLDWALANWSRRAQARGIIPQDFELPEDWRRTCVKWQRPQERALNPVDEQNAVALGLKNLTRNYHETLGADWKAKLRETAEELKFTRELGIPDPRLQTVSGELIESNKNNQQEEQK